MTNVKQPFGVAVFGFSKESVMPGVDVYYKKNCMWDKAAETIKKMVREFGGECFSSRKTQFSASWFSFKFLEPHKHDELNRDIIIRISVNDEARMPSPDRAQEFAESLRAAITNGHGTPSIGVDIRSPSQYVWGSATS